MWPRWDEGGKKVSFNKKDGTLLIFFLNGRKNCIESGKAKALYFVKFTDYHSKQASVQLRKQRRARRKARRMGDMTTAVHWIFFKLLETQFQLKMLSCLSFAVSAPLPILTQIAVSYFLHVTTDSPGWLWRCKFCSGAHKCRWGPSQNWQC